MEPIRRGEMEWLGEGMKEWVATDTFGCYLAGPAWLAGNLIDSG